MVRVAECPILVDRSCPDATKQNGRLPALLPKAARLKCPKLGIQRFQSVELAMTASGDHRHCCSPMGMAASFHGKPFPVISLRFR
jgi:hypothetical protein